MKHQDLIEIGFRLYGVEEDDPYYKLTYDTPFNFNISSISGVLEGDVFWLYGNNKRYSDKTELKDVVNVLGNKIYKFS